MNRNRQSQDEPQDPATDTPSTDDPAVDDTDGCQEFWSQPFPFLQLLFDLLTQLLEALSQFLEQSDGVTQPPVATPAGYNNGNSRRNSRPRLRRKHQWIAPQIHLLETP